MTTGTGPDEEPESGPKEEPVRKRHRNLIHSSLNPIQETTTTTPRAGTPAEASATVGQAPSSSFSFAGAVSEEPSGDLATEERLELDGILRDFDSDSRQKGKALACAKRRGMAFVREQADIVRTSKKLQNLAGAFEKACDSPEGWKRPKSAASQKPAPRKAPEPKPEEGPSEPRADFSAELAWWQSAGGAQKEEILRDPRFGAFRHSMRKGVTTASLGLNVLREVLAERSRKKEAASVAALETPQEAAA